MTHTEILTAGSAVLARRLGGPVRPGAPEPLVDYPGSMSVILRAPVLQGPPGAPAAVILKHLRHGEAARRRETASFRFLSRFPDLEGNLPRFWGADAATGVLVLGDLGSGDQLLGEILEGGDPARARAGLVAFNVGLGRFHAATAGRVPGTAVPGGRRTSRHAVHRLDAFLAALPATLGPLGIRVTGFEAVVTRARKVLAEPGPFRVWTHGDATPANAFLIGDRVALFDFEASGIRHALVDGAFARFRYLHSVWTRFVPGKDQVAGDAAYREALVRGVPAAGEDAAYGEGLLAASLGWFAALVSHLPSVSGADRRWGRSTYRQRVVAGCEHLERLVLETPAVTGFEPAAAVARGAARVLRERWPEEDVTLPLYRAFQS